MAITATTNISETGYTPKASFATGCYLNDWYTDPLKIKTAPDGSVLEYYNHRGTPYANQYFTVKEIIDYNYSGVLSWCRTDYANPSFCGYQKSDGKYWSNLNGGTVSCTYGQIKLLETTITCSRSSASSKTVDVRIDTGYYVNQAPLESYYNWQVYMFFSKPGGGEEQNMIKNRSKSWSATETGYSTITFSFEETSGNTTIANCKCGIWGNGNGVTYNMNPSMGVSKTYTLNIPKYDPYVSPVKQYNSSASKWEEITIRNGTTNDVLAIKQYNGSSWINL